MNDLRTEQFHFNPMDKNDVEEVYRELCKAHKTSVTKAKAFSDAQQSFSLFSLIKLAIHFNLKFEMDAMKETMTIWYPEAGNPPVKIVLDENTTKTIEENNPGLKEQDAAAEVGDDEIEKFTYPEIPKEPLPKTDQDVEDMF